MSEEEYHRHDSPESPWIYLPARRRGGREEVDMIYEGRTGTDAPNKDKRHKKKQTAKATFLRRRAVSGGDEPAVIGII